MKRFNRRQFIGSATRIAGAGLAAPLIASCGRESGRQEVSTAEPKVPWRYAVCNEIMEGWEWQRQCEFAAEVGYAGLEVAPFTLAEHVGDISPARRDELRGVAEALGLEILGLHWLLVSPKGLHVTSPDTELRARSWDYVKQLGDLCADLGGAVMIFGSPNQRGTVGISKEQAIAHFTEGCKSVAEHLAERSVQLLIEPLSSDQTDVINTVAEAVAVVEEVNHPAISSMFDFHNTADETEPLDAIVRAHFDRILHIQIQEMDGTYMGTGSGEADYLPALRAFRDLGYAGWVSLEVFDFEVGPEKIMLDSFSTLKRMEGRL